jgi:hypothetical protein
MTTIDIVPHREVNGHHEQKTEYQQSKQTRKTSDASPVGAFWRSVHLSSKPQRTRESKLEPEPFLRSLPAYRYLQR